MKQVIINNYIIKLLFFIQNNNNLSIISDIKPLTFCFVVATLLCNYQQAFCAPRSSAASLRDAIAQIPNPNSLPSDRLEDIPVTPLPSNVLPQPSQPEPLLPPPQLPETQIPGQDDPNVKFPVSRIEVVGSTVFKSEDFASIAAPFVGRFVSFAELLQVKDAITKFYTDRGYATTGAFIIPQISEAGVIKIQVIKLIPPLKGVGFRGHGAWGMGCVTYALCPMPAWPNGEASIHPTPTICVIPRRFL